VILINKEEFMSSKMTIASVLFVVLVLVVALIYGCGAMTGGGLGLGWAPQPRLYAATTDSHVDVLNLETLTTEESIVFPGASVITGVTMSPDRKVLYAVDKTADKLFSYNLQTLAFDSVGTGIGLDYCYMSPDGSKVFVVGGPGTKLFQFSTSPLALEAIITVEATGSSYGVAVSSNSAYAYFAGYDFDKIYKYDINAKTLVSAEVPGGTEPSTFAFHPNGQKLYFTAYAGSAVRVLDVATFTVEATSISVGTGPWGIVFTSNGEKAYVANDSSHTISVISVEANSEIGTISDDTSSGPAWLVVDETRDRLYVGGWSKSMVTVINTKTDTVLSTFEAGGDQITM
jgi:YVTN family beta-propeller protein